MQLSLSRLLATTALAAIAVATPAVAEETVNFNLQQFYSSVDQNTSNRTVRSILKDIGRAAYGRSVNTTSASADIGGTIVTINSSETAQNVARRNDFTVDINGHAVRGLTTARSFESFNDDRDRITIQVDGQQIYSGTIQGLTNADLLALYNAIGVTESREIVGRETTRATTSAQFRAISQRISGFLSPRALRSVGKGKDESADSDQIQYSYDNGIYGVAAGNEGQKIGVWANGSYTFLEGRNSNAEFDGGQINGLVGADYLVATSWGTVLGGLSLGGERSDLQTRFNLGTSDSSGFSVLPYAGVAFMDGLVVIDALAGYSWLNTENTRNRPFTKINGDYDGNRITSAANVTVNYGIGNVMVSPSVGGQFAYEYGERYLDSAGTDHDPAETYIADLKVGARFGLTPRDDIEVYTSHYYLYDLVPVFSDHAREADADRDELQSTLGITWITPYDLEASFEITNSFFRNNVNNTSLLVNARMTF